MKTEMWCIDLGRRLNKPHCYPVVARGTYALGTQDSALVGLDIASGQLAWEHPLDEGSAAHALATDGERLFVGCQDVRAFPAPGKALLAFDARTGERVWGHPTTAHSLSAATLTDGTVYFTATDGLLHAVDAATGQEHWVTEHPIWGEAAPAVGEGMVCAGGQGQTLFAYAVADGTEMWRFSVEGAWFVARSCINGRVFVPCSNGHLYALDTHTGRLLWELESERGLGCTTPPTAAGDRLFMGSRVYRQVEGQQLPGYAMLALNASSGAEEWRFHTARHISAPPTVAGDTLFFGTDDEFYAVDTTSGEERWRMQVRSWVVTQPQVTGGHVYFGERNGLIHAVRWRAKSGDESCKPGAPLRVQQGIFANSHALLIGIDGYRHLQPLTKATVDVRDLRDVLAQSGYPSTNLTLLTNEQATKT
jgi:outer membrane protein assembly factor BamB